jgi:hypothetical protein
MDMHNKVFELYNFSARFAVSDECDSLIGWDTVWREPESDRKQTRTRAGSRPLPASRAGHARPRYPNQAVEIKKENGGGVQ